MEKVVIYQELNRFCMTRKKEVRKLDSEELIRELNKAREQLVQMKSDMNEFERDIKIMEQFEPIAVRIRESEIAQAKKDREQASK